MGVNKQLILGRLVKDPEVTVLQSGSKVAKFTLAVNEKKKNKSTGQWEDDVEYFDCEAWSNGEWKKDADTIEKYCKKGSQIFVEGKTKTDKWEDKKTGEKRSKKKVVVEAFSFCDSKSDGVGGSTFGPVAQNRRQPQPQPQQANSDNDPDEYTPF